MKVWSIVFVTVALAMIYILKDCSVHFGDNHNWDVAQNHTHKPMRCTHLNCRMLMMNQVRIHVHQLIGDCP